MILPKGLVDKIINLLSKEEPTIIYTPLLDGHTDHVETTRAVIKALKDGIVILIGYICMK